MERARKGVGLRALVGLVALVWLAGFPSVLEAQGPVKVGFIDELTKKLRSPYIFRSSFSNSDGSHPTGEWLYKQGYRKAVLMASDFGGSIEHIGGVARTFTEAGGQVIQEIYMDMKGKWAK